MPEISQDALKKAEQYIEEEEGAVSRLRGGLGWFLTGMAVLMSLFHLWTVYGIVPTQMLRGIHLAFVLFLCFLMFPALKRWRNRLMWFDVLLALAALACIGYMLADFDDFIDRAVVPTRWDIVFGVALIVLVLEAARRSTGWVMPLVAAAFLAYALFGQHLPSPWTHRGYDIERLVGHMYMTLEGIFGTALDVSATLIILFTIYGAFLQQSGAGKFFIDFSFAATGGRSTSAGRTIVLSSFLLGGPSGSGVATTVTLGSAAYPVLEKAGYDKDSAGGLLAAGGLGAILSPPVLGAAAFLIAEFLKISYMDVILMAVIPTLLYYLSLFIMVELDSRRFGMHGVSFTAPVGAWALTKRYGFHFVSLIAIVAFMLAGFSPMASVFWATVVAFATSFINKECALTPRKLLAALEGGSVGMLNVGATCACAGLIVGVVTLTGLGLKFSDIVIAYAGNSLPLTALYTALIVWIVGLAVPVTASYIICAVIAAPALIKLGVPDFAAHMFIFYYAVLSEVSPPTALSPFAAAAITGGNPYRTTMMSWKYTLPAFVVPFMFVLDPAGLGLLLKGSWQDVALSSVTAMVGIAALAAGAQNWALKRCNPPERWLLIGAGLLLVYPQPLYDAVGVGLTFAVLVVQKLRKEAAP
ncbi:MAG: TRAP transporter fused permease subunit [Betaproteobacteria bacterium]|nr:TRAP transporter fused permease subunit [Betaproteobacteria bacterium]